MKINSKNIRIIIAILLYLISLVGVHFDQRFDLRWTFFAIYNFAWMILLSVFYNVRTLPHKWLQLAKSGLSNKYTLIVIIIILISRLAFINIYPFNSIGDENRDGAKVVEEILEGRTKNIFEYGPYNGFGLIAPTVLIPFQLLLPNDALAFKIPATIVSALDLFVIFLLLQKFVNIRVAAIATIIIASLPVHMYYGRTEFLVMTSSLFSTLLFWATYNLHTSFSKKNIVNLAIISGIALGFQPSVRIILIISGLFTLFIIFKNIRKAPKTTIFKALLYVMGVLIAFGPRILFSNQTTLFQINKLEISTASELFFNYTNSLAVIGFTPTASHFYLHAPLLNTVYLLLFGIGIFVLVKHKTAYFKYLFFSGLLLIPLLNSALTNFPNADHRLTVLSVYLAIGIAFGMEYLFNLVEKFTLIKAPLILGLIFIIGINFFQFFDKEYASYSMFIDTNNNNYQNYLSTYLAHIVKANPKLNDSPTLCIYGNGFELDHKRRAHIMENLLYLTNNKIISFYNDETLQNRIIAVNTECANDQRISNVITLCSPYTKFSCPNDKLPLKIYVY